MNVVARRWLCEFVNDSGEARTIAIGLTKDERAAACRTVNPVLEAQARALTLAYKKVPMDFRHSGPPAPAWDC
jgi:hypothetical protein